MRARVFVSLLLSLTTLSLEGCEGCTPPGVAPDAGAPDVLVCDDDGDCDDGLVCRARGCVLADAGAASDGGGDAGAGGGDAGADGGASDAGVDAGSIDAGSDGGAPDDAGSNSDAGFDAGVLDAGPDAGLVDAGLVDAGPCASSRDCPLDLVCADLRDEGAAVTPFCNEPTRDVSDALVAEACAASSDCDTGLCLPRAAVCSVACEDTALDCPTGAVCTAYPFGMSSTWIGVCAAGCSDDADCEAPRVCTYNGNPLTNAFDAICEVPAGPGDLGAACDDPEDCISGLCAPEGCTRACDDDGDCTGGAPGNTLGACRATTVGEPVGAGTTTLRMCRP